MDRSMIGRLEGRTALVTGAASGIGLGIASRFIAEGASVLLVDRNRAGLQTAIETIDRSSVSTAIVDVTSEDDVRRMVHEVVEAFGRLDIAVNGAFGIDVPSSSGAAATGISICDEPDERWSAVIDVGLVAPYRCIRHEARHMVAQGTGGVIINIASINARQPVEGMSAYCSAKAGLEMLTRCAALELGPHGIRVTAIGPGLVDTPMTSFLTSNPALLREYLSHVPLGRAGTPDDIAALAVFLASDEASWISGDTIFADGAQLTRGYPRR